MIFFEIFPKIEKSRNFQWKSYMIFIEIFDFFQFSENFQKMYFFYFFYFFQSISDKIFFGVEKKSEYSFESKNHIFRLVMSSEWLRQSFIEFRAISWKIQVFFHKTRKLINVLCITTLNLSQAWWFIPAILFACYSSSIGRF